MRLGDSTLVLSRRQAPKRQAARLAPRPVLRDDGLELLVVWYPHKDAPSLLPTDYPSIDGRRLASGTPDLARRIRSRVQGDRL